MLIIRKTIPFYVSIALFKFMMKLFRWRSTLPFLLVVMLIGSCLIVGCASKTVSIQTIPQPTTSKVTIQTATPAPTGTQGRVSSREPFVQGSSVSLHYKKGQDVTINGTAFGGATSLTLTVYYLCELDAPCLTRPGSLKGSSNYVIKDTVPINADTTFSTTMGTGALKSGAYVVFFDLPTGQYSSMVFQVED
jgi:hypothetical protein